MWQLIRGEWRLLLFGFLMTFWSSPGQTFLISLFSGELRAELDLSDGEFIFAFEQRLMDLLDPGLLDRRFEDTRDLHRFRVGGQRRRSRIRRPGTRPHRLPHRACFFPKPNAPDQRTTN